MIWTSDFVKQAVIGFARHGLTTAAGILVADGYLMGSQANDFIGAGLFFVGLGWSVWQKYQVAHPSK